MNARGEQRWNCLHLQYMYQFLYLFVGLAPSGVCLSTADYAVTVRANSSLWSMCLRAADCVGEEKLKVGKARPLLHHCIKTLHIFSFLSDMLTSMH